MLKPRATLVRPLAALAVLALSATLALAEAAPYDRWFVVELDGQRAGWSHSKRVVGNDIVTSEEMSLTMGRGEQTVTITIGGTFSETPDHEPLEFRTSQNLGAFRSTETLYTFFGEYVSVSTNGQTSRAPMPEGDWMTPAEASHYFAERFEAGDEEITVRTLAPTEGLEPVTVTRKNFERVTIDALGKKVPAIKCTVTTSNAPGIESIEFIDENGEALRGEVEMMGMKLVSLLADEQLAKSPLNPPEIMRATFVTPSRPIENARGLSKGAYRLTIAEGNFPDLPSEGVQRVEPIEDAAGATVTIDTHATPTALAAGEKRDAYLKPSLTLECEDPAVVKLAGTVEDADSPRDTAEHLRRLVHRHINAKALSVGLATAAEVARTREGDCTEHAVLLAALLRAKGIPARVASGLIYADAFAGSENIFGYHMWTQALLPDDSGTERWMDLDATLPASTPYDATHITLAVSDLNGASPINSLVTLAPLMGQLKIEVLSTK
ncbi:MAG: hypothetical protein CMJ31_05755 [Phycisphaerae bacterium]|nr:hypothetical protein [Phycisphaerae bacterium]